MRALRTVFISLAFVLLAAHFSRAGHDGVAVLAVLLPLLLFVRKPWARWSLRVVLLVGAVEWLRTLFRLVGERRAMGADWARLAAILGAVSVVTLLAAWAVRVSPSVDPGIADAGGESP
jgi:hypothetical protein